MCKLADESPELSHAPGGAGGNPTIHTANFALQLFSNSAEENYVFSFDDPQSAVIQIASASPGEPQRSVSCLFHGLQGKRLALVSSEPITVSTTLSVNYNDAMFLGEVVACCPESAMSWQLEINVEQILTGLQSLLALRNNLIGDTAVNAKPSAMTPACVRK